MRRSVPPSQRGTAHGSGGTREACLVQGGELLGGGLAGGLQAGLALVVLGQAVQLLVNLLNLGVPVVAAGADSLDNGPRGLGERNTNHRPEGKRERMREHLGIRPRSFQRDPGLRAGLRRKTYGTKGSAETQTQEQVAHNDWPNVQVNDGCGGYPSRQEQQGSIEGTREKKQGW